MGKLRGEEAWAGACLEAALPDVEVRQHDDGSRPSMYDLDLVRRGEVAGACEVTAAADPQQIELWNLLNARGDTHIEPGLRGGWHLVLSSSCRVKELRTGLRPLLETMESRQIRRGGRESGPDDVEEVVDRLGISYLCQRGTKFPGSVYFTVDPPRGTSAGFVPDTGDALCEWLETWIAERQQAHNIDKLTASGAPRRHLYVIQAAFSAPFQAADVLMRDSGPLPVRPLSLPEGLTDLWVMSAWSTGDVFAWDTSGGWTRHEKIMTVPHRLAT